MNIVIKLNGAAFSGTCKAVSSFDTFFLISNLKLADGKEVCFDTYFSGEGTITEIETVGTEITLF